MEVRKVNGKKRGGVGKKGKQAHTRKVPFPAGDLIIKHEEKGRFV